MRVCGGHNGAIGGHKFHQLHIYMYMAQAGSTILVFNVASLMIIWIPIILPS